MKKLLVIFFVFVISISLIAIDVSGNQSGLWSPENNPYNVVGDITVPAGETLEIQPGVIVSVQGYYQITAEGNILAIGAEADSILFFGFNNLSWSGIRLESEIQQSEFYYCYIEDTNDINDYGINSINSPILINHCSFENHKKAIHFSGLISTSPSYMEIKNSKIWDCEQNGILITDNSNALIDSCEVTQCGLGTQFYAAIQLALQNSAHDCSPTISNSYIHHNGKQGITTGNLFNYDEMAPTVENNIISYNYTGIYLYNAKGYYKDNLISNNFEEGNTDSGAGVMLYGSGASGTFTYNHIHGNYTGFYITTDATANIGDLNNASTDDDGFNMIHDNVFYTGETYSIYNESAMDVMAENNVWDYDIPIDETIIDGNDNPAYGIVDYEPFLSVCAPPDSIIITEQYECYPWEYAYPTYLVHNSWNIYIDGVFVENFQYGTYYLPGFGMIPGQSYLIEITFLYDEGESIPADTTFIYNPMILNPPQNPQITDTNFMFWEEPEQGSTSMFLNYNVYLDGVLFGSTAELFWLYIGLPPGTYIFEVSAVYEDGESELVEASWVQAIHNPPSNAGYEVFPDYIHLTWESPVGSNVVVEEYHIYLDGELYEITTELFCNIFDLIPCIEYEIALTAYYIDGIESDPIIFNILFVEGDKILNLETKLLGNHPNPFNPSTTISFSVTQNVMSGSDGSPFVNFVIYNLKGQKVKCLDCGESFSTIAPMYRDYSITWDGKDENGKEVTSGIYFYKLNIDGNTVDSKKMLLLK